MLNKNNLPKIKNGTLNPIQLKKSINPLLSKNLNTEKSNTLKMTINCDSQVYKTEKEKISDFLKSLNLENYTDLFVNKGINSEEKLQLINYDILKLLKIPYAHCKRILTKLKDMKKTPLNLEMKKFNRNNSNYEEIICPKEEDDIEQNEEEQRKTFYEAISLFKKTHSYFFPKEENNNTDENNNDNKNEKNIENEFILKGEYIENNKKENSLNDKSISTSPKKNNNNFKIDISKPIKEARQFFPLNKTKTLCHQCLHMILQEHCIQKYNKLFCSLHCLDIFENKNITFCHNCKKKIEIVYAFPSLIHPQTFFCSSQCLNLSEPNLFNNINQSQVINLDNVQNQKLNNSDNDIVDILDL